MPIRRAAALLLVAAGTAHAQPTPGSLQDALRLSTARMDDSAAVLLEAIVAGGMPGTPRAAQELVGIYARTHRLDDAHRAFQQARASGADFSGLASRPDIGALRSDARFAALFPDRASFDRPFVEDARIIHEWRGERAGDEFGWIARGIGDVDGDRVTDVVVSATTNPPLGTTEGRLYAYSGRSGRRLWQVDGQRGWLLGTSVEAAGDVDRDGVPDVVAGAPGGRLALILSGRDGRALRRLQGDSAEANFGGAVSGAGDVDRDGHADVVVGASGTGVLLRGAGRAVVFSGRTGERLLTLEGERENDAFGSAVAGGDGRLAVGAATAGAARRGRVYLFAPPRRAPVAVQEADSTGRALGAMFVSVLGDVDGDGAVDFLVTSAHSMVNGPRAGRVHVVAGTTRRAR